MYRYSGRNFSDQDIKQIRNIIRSGSSNTRAQLSRVVCKEFNWLKRDGKLKEMSCRVAMLGMHRDGLIKLPPPKYPHHSGCYDIELTLAADPQPIVDTPVHKLSGLHLTIVDRSTSHLWNEYIDRYHYLGYKSAPGDQIRYFIKEGKRYLGAMRFSAAAWKVQPRDHFVGWNEEQRKRNLHLVISQSRFLILPWIKCKNLATKSLSMATKCVSSDWQNRYGYRPVLIETFVMKEKFSGICYQAANWVNVGFTQGRGRLDQYEDVEQQVKSIWLCPLSKSFREKLRTHEWASAS